MIIITLIIAGALAYGYWDHNHQRRHLGKSFALLATKYGGEVKPGSLWRLGRFSLDDVRRQINPAKHQRRDSKHTNPQ